MRNYEKKLKKILAEIFFELILTEKIYLVLPHSYIYIFVQQDSVNYRAIDLGKIHIIFQRNFTEKDYIGKSLYAAILTKPMPERELISVQNRIYSRFNNLGLKHCGIFIIEE
jgi:hypothetical protein